MIYPLQLNLPNGRFTQRGESRKMVKETLESINDFEKRLTWYNTHVRSLATYEKLDAEVYYRWGNPNQTLKVFCNCKKCRLSADFDKKQEMVYQRVRAKEIERLKTGVDSKDSYKNKLNFLFATKGFIPDNIPSVWDSYSDEPIIYFGPSTKEERQVYNQFVINDFNKEYKNANRFTQAYSGFDFEKELQRLNERLQQPETDKPVLLQYIKTQIEKHFDYPESIHRDNRANNIGGHILQQIDRQLEHQGHIHDLFGRLCFGETIDLLSVTGLNNYELLKYTHTLEIFKLYQYVKQLIQNPQNLTKLLFFDTIKNDKERESEKSKLITIEKPKHKGEMITESVKNLFRFIDFIHSKTEDFLSKQNLIDKVMELHTKRNSLKPDQSFKDRIEYNKVQADFEQEFDVLKRETTIIIIEKIHELNIADISTPIINLNARGDLFELQRNFGETDLEEIFEAKRKYLEFRTKTNFHYFLEFFFYDLDRDLKGFFDYFKETTENEFEPFGTKTIQANSAEEAAMLFQKGVKSVSLQHDFFNPSKVQLNRNEALPSQSLDTPLPGKYSSCTSETFRTDISELCYKCPFRDLIQNGIVNQIEFQAKQKNEVLTKEQFAKYVESEIESASKAMERQHLIERQNPKDKHFRGNRIEIYIFNKERIRALNLVMSNDTGKDKQDFERELEKYNIPFKEIIKNNPSFKNELFKQYYNAETRPSFDLYLADFYTKDKLDKGIEEAHNQIPVSTSKDIVAASFVATTPFENHINELKQEFLNKVVKNGLPLKYYCHDIEKTVIVKSLQAINKEYDILKKSAFEESTDKYKEAEIRANNVIENSKMLESFGNDVLVYLKQDQENIYLYLHEAEKKYFDFWDTLKSNFNNRLLKLMPVQSINNILERNENIDVTRDKVCSTFSFMQFKDLRKHKLILDGNDFEKLIEWVTYYFINGFSLPEIKEPIKNVNTNKGNVIFTFKKFFKSEYPESTYPVSLFHLYTGCFYEFRNDQLENFIKQSEPQYYQELIKNVK